MVAIDLSPPIQHLSIRCSLLELSRADEDFGNTVIGKLTTEESV